MRKRIVIGAIAVAVIGVVAFFVSSESEDSVEYHKEGYRSAWTGTRLQRMRARFTGYFIRPDAVRMDRHLKGLLRLGYLEERIFVLSNQPPEAIVPALYTEASQSGLNLEFVTFAPCTNGIRVVAVTNDMPAWGRVVRRLDRW